MSITAARPFRVHAVNLPARSIFGMVGRCGGGYNTIWEDWSPEGRVKRELIMADYEREMDELCGHYRRLEESVLAEGFRNPIIITCGLPRKRRMENLPPEMRVLPPSELLLCEMTMGGSRLHVAQKHDISIPCIVNDWTGRFRDSPEIRDAEEAFQLYRDPPKSITISLELGLVESFSQNKVGYHLGPEWSEDRLMPLRAPIWIRIMNRHGYRVHKLPRIVEDVLVAAGVNQDHINQ